MKLSFLFVLFVLVILLLGCVAEEKEIEVEKEKEIEEVINLAGKNVVMIVAPKNFRDEELLQPKEVLERAGANVTIASKGTANATGMLGARVNVDIDISELDSAKYDAVIFVGGTGASVYFNDATAHSIAKKAVAEGKILGAICIAPSTLANAGVLKGKRATSWPSEADNLRAKGAEYTGEAVTVDGKIITARGPDAAQKFGETIARALQ